jgi:hypothetical protein
VDEVPPPGRLAVFGFQHVFALLRLSVEDADRAEQQHHRGQPGQPGGDYLNVAFDVVGYREAKPDPTRVATAQTSGDTSGPV